MAQMQYQRDGFGLVVITAALTHAYMGYAYWKFRIEHYSSPHCRSLNGEDEGAHPILSRVKWELTPDQSRCGMGRWASVQGPLLEGRVG
jgi:hypothetical protein